MTTAELPVVFEQSGAHLLLEMNDADWRIRRNAVAELAKSGDKNAVQAILQTLRNDHGNLNIASSAIELLASAGVNTLAALVDLLDDPHPELRCCAALTLGLQNNVRAIPPLLAALDDRESNVRYHVIEALGNLRAAAASLTLMDIAETRDFTLAFPALEALAKTGDRRVARRLLPLLCDDLLQTAVIDALGSLGGKEAVEPLACLLNVAGASTEAITRNLVRLHERFPACSADGSFVANAIRTTIKSAGVQNLLDALHATDGRSHLAVAKVLAWLGNPAVDQVLVKGIGLPDVLTLFIDKGWVAVDLLIEQIANPDFEVREAAVIALGRIGSAAAVPALLIALKQDAELAVAAAGALAMIGDRRAYDPLLDLLEWEDPAIRRAAVSALNSLGHIRMPADMARRLDDPRPHVRECAVRIIGYAGFPDLIDLLIQHCREEHEGVRRAAVESLPCLEADPRILSTLALAAADPAAAVRAAAMRTLAKFNAPMAIALLRKGLADASVWVRYYAARSLARLHDTSAMDDLLRLAQEDQAVQVRVAAVEAIGALGKTGAVAVLVVLTESSEIDLARAALAALGAMGQSPAVPILSKVLASGDADRKLEAIRALSGTRSRDAVAPLAKAAASPDSGLAHAAIIALQQLGLPEAVDALIDVASAPSLRDACVEALAKCDPSHVLNGLTHPNLDVRLAVVGSMARLKSWRDLNTGLSDLEGAVRFAALDALANAESPPAPQKLAQMAVEDADLAVRSAAQAMLQG